MQKCIAPWLVGLSMVMSAFSQDRAAAQTVPSEFLGVWRLVEDGGGACKRADWNDARGEGYVRIAQGVVEFWETTCRASSVRRARGEPTGAPTVVDLVCRGEGKTWRESNIWQIERIDGQTVFLRVNTTRSFVSVFRQCP